MQELARRGLLPRPRLLLAAYLGSSGALTLLGDAGFPEEPNLLTWLRGLGKGRLGRRKKLAREALVRAGLAIVGLLRTEQAFDASYGRDVEEGARRLEAWLEAPERERQHGAAVVWGLSRSELAKQLHRLLSALELQDAASALARLADEAGSRLAKRHRNHRQVLRGAIQDTLLAWLFASRDAE